MNFVHKFNNIFALYTGLADFCQPVEKTVFSMVKTGLAKIVFAGKNRFLPAKIGS